MTRTFVSARDQVARLQQWAAVDEPEEAEEAEKPSFLERMKKTWAERPTNGGFAGGRSAVKTDGMDPASHAYRDPEPKRIPSPNPRFEPDSWEDVPNEDDESGYNWGPEPGIPESHTKRDPVRTDAQWGADAMRTINQGGGEGMSFHGVPGEAPTSGYMVGRPGTEHDIPHGKLNPAALRDYYEQHADTLEEPGNFMGGWQSTGRPGTPRSGQPQWYFDISRNIQDPAEAAAYAQQGNQDAVYHLDSGKEIPTSEMVQKHLKGGSHGKWYL